MIHRLPFWVFAGSVLLALNAGFINSVALLSFVNNAVSHVTGTATIAAEALTRHDWQLLWHTGAIILSFIAGAMVSGLVIGNEALKLGRRYGVALLIESALLLFAWYGFTHNTFHAEWLASAACGLQNAMVATYSGSVIRTTHLTGIVSDIGSALGNLLAGRGFARPQLILQTAIFFAFIGGAAAGAVGFRSYGYDAVLFNGIWVMLVALAYMTLLFRAAGREH